MARELRLLRVDVRTAADADEAQQVVGAFAPEAVVVDLHACDDDELVLFPAIARASGAMRIIALLPYRSLDLATRVGRLGATTSVEKPIAAKEILAALSGTRVNTTSVRDLLRVQQDYARRTLAECGGNLSETARLLNIDRRTLRKLISTNDVD